MPSWNDRIPFPSVRGQEPVVRRARLLAARTYLPRSRPRWAIMMGHWDGGSVLAKFGLPMRLPEGTPGHGCEALNAEGAQAGEQSLEEPAVSEEAAGEAETGKRRPRKKGSAAAEAKEAG